MKKGIVLFLLLVLVVAVYFVSRTKSAVMPTPTDGKITVAASGYVPYILAKQMGAEKINLSMLLPANAEPHSFEPTPGTMIALNNADIFIYISSVIEPWVKDVLAGAKPQTQILEAALPFSAEKDPHVWMNFAHASQIAAAIEQALAQKDPKNASYYADNLQAFKQEIAALDQAFSQGLADCQSRTVVHIGHLAFENLTKNYNLALRALTGTSHDGEHSVKKIAEMVRFIQQNNIQTIFTEEALSPQLSGMIARETHAQILPLYTIEHVSKDEFDHSVTYGALMKKNLDSLQRGLSCTL